MPKFMNQFWMLQAPKGDADGGGAGGGADDKENQDNPGGNTDNEVDDENPGGDQKPDKKNADDKGPKTLEEAQALIKKLNAENAKNRVTNKNLKQSLDKHGADLKKVKDSLGIKDDAADPETTIKGLKETNEAYEVRMSVMALQIEHGIPSDQSDYFQFLLGKEFDSLEEGAEISEDQIQGVVDKVKLVSSGKKKNSTSEGGKPPAEDTGGGDRVTLEAFKKMNLGEKSALYGSDPKLYEKLTKQSRARA